MTVLYQQQQNIVSTTSVMQGDAVTFLCRTLFLLIKAIETKYNGYKFRSRLEARWAVFFDAANIKYEYEPEGYELADNERYLPDFYLPDEDIFVEVKAPRESAFFEIKKAIKFVKSANKPLLILSNLPDTSHAIWFYPALYYHPVTCCVHCHYCFFNVWYDDDDKQQIALVRDFCDPINVPLDRLGVIEFSEVTSVRELREIEKASVRRLLTPFYDSSEFPYEDCLSKDEKQAITMCYELARQARFEHGETPEVSR